MAVPVLKYSLPISDDWKAQYNDKLDYRLGPEIWYKIPWWSINDAIIIQLRFYKKSVKGSKALDWQLAIPSVKGTLKSFNDFIDFILHGFIVWGK